MKSWPTSNWPTLLQSGAKLVSIIVLTLQNGSVKQFTDNSDTFYVSGFTDPFDSVSGLIRSAISISSSLDTSNLDIQLNMNPIQQNTNVNPSQAYVRSAINLTDVLGGMYRGATFHLALTFPDNPGEGYMPMLSGILGETKVGRNTFKATLESQIFNITVQTPLTTTPSCRNKFGDSYCGINKNSYAISTTISAVSDNQHFTIPVVLNNPAIIAGYPLVGSLQNVFIFGGVQWTSGGNSGLSTEIGNITLHSSTTDIQLWLPVGFNVSVGDSIVVYPGCSKQRSNCVAYKNCINMNAEPDVPGITMMTSATSLV